MTTDFDQIRSQTKNRFGQLSKSMFFARHVAHPRYLRFIDGVAGQRICNVREKPVDIPVSTLGETTKPLLTDPRFNINFDPHSFNDKLRRSYADKIQPKRRRERLLPPLPGWNPTGTVVEDTENWRRELARIGEMVGLITTNELYEIEKRKETPTTPAYSQTSSPMKSSVPPTGHYSRLSGRWNETPKSTARSRSLRRRTTQKSFLPDRYFCVDEQEREMWMLQVLCQILQTDSLNEIQSWLVSSGPSEKEAARQLITKAIKGLEENERILNNGSQNENAKAIQVNMDSFGSLLAKRFPNVSSSISSNPFDNNLTRSFSRPRTAPTAQAPSKTEFHSKSTGSFHTNLETLNETIEIEPFHTKNIVPQPTHTDIQHDVQILTLDDNPKPNQPITIEVHEQSPF